MDPLTTVIDLALALPVNVVVPEILVPSETCVMLNCAHPSGGPKRATHGPSPGIWLFCAQHGMAQNMARRRARMCEECGLHIPVFAIEGATRGTHCAACRTEGMVDVVSRMCYCGLHRPTYRVVGSVRATHCVTCRLPGMINILVA